MLLKVKVLAHHIELANLAVVLSKGRNRGLICPIAQALKEALPDHEWSVGSARVYRDGEIFALVPHTVRRWIMLYDEATVVQGLVDVASLPTPPGEIFLWPISPTLEGDCTAIRKMAAC